MERLNVAELKSICVQRHWTVGTAESCTGGLLAAAIAQEPGVSAFFHGSIVSYARRVKVRILGVPEALIDLTGEVSEEVAKAMAQGARDALDCDWAVAVTGIAGPTGGSAEKPVGTVCFAVAGPTFESSVRKHFQTRASDAGARQDIQRQAALFAFEFLLSGMR
jgi:nicotinamide-nucleotide amidase